MAALPFVALAASAAGPLMQGLSSAASDHYGAQVAKNNAIIAQNNAQYTAGAGAAQTEAAGLKARQQGAGVKAGLAAENVDVTSGSAADVQQSQAEISKLDTATIANRAAMETYGYRTQNIAYSAQSRLDNTKAVFDIVGSAIGSAGNVAKDLPDVPGMSSLLSGPSTTPSPYGWMGGNSAGGDEEFGGTAGTAEAGDLGDLAAAFG